MVQILGAIIQYLLEQMAVAQWKAARACNMEYNIYDQGALTESRMRTLEYALKQQTRWEPAYFKVLRELQALQKARPPQPEPESELSEQSHSDPQPKQDESDAPIPQPPAAAPDQDQLPGSEPVDSVSAKESKFCL